MGSIGRLAKGADYRGAWARPDSACAGAPSGFTLACEDSRSVSHRIGNENRYVKPSPRLSDLKFVLFDGVATVLPAEA